MVILTDTINLEHISMATPITSGKVELDAQHVEELQESLTQQRPVHYVPRNDEEKRLDKRVNLKLDLFVVTILALEFIVGPI